MCGPGRRGLGALGDGPAPVATAAQRSTAMRRQDPSGRDLYGETASMAAGSLNSRFIFAPIEPSRGWPFHLVFYC
jgi:hypothetical protein